MSIGLVNDEDFFAELAGGRSIDKRTPEKSTDKPNVVREEERSKDREDIPADGTIPTERQSTRSVIEVLTPKGRKAGDNNVPDSLRKVIAEEALLNGRDAALDLGASFGLSPASVSAYSKGATSTASYNQPSKELIGHINKSRERAMKRAGKTLNAALSSITQEKLDYADVKDLAGIAKDMSVIIKNLEPKEVATEASGAATPQFVIYAPQFKREDQFNLITVQE